MCDEHPVQPLVRRLLIELIEPVQALLLADDMCGGKGKPRVLSPAITDALRQASNAAMTHLLPKDLSSVPVAEMTAEERAAAAVELAKEIMARYDTLKARSGRLRELVSWAVHDGLLPTVDMRQTWRESLEAYDKCM